MMANVIETAAIKQRDYMTKQKLAKVMFLCRKDND